MVNNGIGLGYRVVSKKLISGHDLGHDPGRNWAAQFLADISACSYSISYNEVSLQPVKCCAYNKNYCDFLHLEFRVL